VTRLLAWTRETRWRQGSVLTPECVTKLKLPGKDGATVAVVVSHDCDIASDIEVEPNIEVLVGRRIDTCSADNAHAKNIRKLHFELNGPTGRTAWEILAQDKISIPKQQLVDFQPDSTYSIAKDELETLRTWLAARYKRATIPDGLQRLVKDVFMDVGKKGDRPRALRGIWIDFEPDLDQLRDGEIYELWVVVVYSSSEADAKKIAEETAKQIREKFEKRYLKGKKWSEMELRECVIRSDTEFTHSLCTMFSNTNSSVSNT
jgi:hypothetical protein